MSSAVRDSDELMRSLQHISEESLSALDLANLINDSFLFPMQDFTPLSAETFQLPQDYSTAQPFAVTAHAVYLQLTSINPKKVSGPDGIPAWLLKENADLLSDTVTDIINCSFAESRLPPWKSADTMPIPKQKPIKYINKHLCPISLTLVLCKVAEEFVVAQHLRPSILKKIGDNRFGAIPESSTMHALISMVHSWTKHTDGTGSTVRVVLFDYRKAFDLIDPGHVGWLWTCWLAYRFGSSISLQIARRESNWEKIACLNGGTYRQGCFREPSSGLGCLFS